MKSAVVFGAIVVGFVLLAASSMWTSLFPATSTWTPEKAQRSSEVKDRLNNLSSMLNRSQSMHRGQDPGPLKAEFDELMKENDQLNAEFESASTRPNRIAAILKWSGISLAAVGLIGWYATREA